MNWVLLHIAGQDPYVKYTIDSRPLFFGTVNGAVRSSTV